LGHIETGVAEIMAYQRASNEPRLHVVKMQATAAVILVRVGFAGTVFVLFAAWALLIWALSP